MLESPYSSKAVTSFTPERAVSVKSDSVIMVVPQRVVLYFNSSICYMACTGITDFHVRAGRSGDRILVGARFFASVQTGPGAHPVSYTMGAGSIPGVKRPGRGVYHPPTSFAEVKEGVELYLSFPSGPSWPVIGRTLAFLPLPLPL